MFRHLNWRRPGRRTPAPDGTAVVAGSDETGADETGAGDAGSVDAVEPPTVTWETSAVTVAMPCPNCADADHKRKLLTVHFRSPDYPTMRHWAVLVCAACDARFYENPHVPDYAEPKMLERGRLPFYIQQGAGVAMITRPLALVAAPAGSRYLEVGCGLGFGLDFAIQARGWQGSGIDPSALSAYGRDQLELPIDLRYLRDEPDLAETCDVVMGSEVIEHLPSPRDFVATLKTVLKPGGMLILTTPNGEEIVAGASPGSLIPMLSPGLHMVFQTAESLRLVLNQSGFRQVEIRRDGQGLVAFASDRVFTLNEDEAAVAESYRAYLVQRAGAMTTASDLALGFAGRALLEAANAGDPVIGRRAWDILLPACRARFALNLETITRLPAGAPTASLGALAGLMPLNLATILYGAAMLALAAGATRASQADRFAAAAAAADALRQALQKLALDDGLAENIGWVSRMEALLCLAQTGAADSVARLLALPPSPGNAGKPEADIGRTIAIRRVFSTLVNGGHYRLARQIAESPQLASALVTEGSLATSSPLPPTECDALFGLAVLDLQPPVAPDRAARRFARVIKSLTPALSSEPKPTDLIWAAVRGLLAATEQNGDHRGAAKALRDLTTPEGGPAIALPPDIAALLERGDHRGAA